MFKRILVAVDFSDVTEAVVARGRDLALAMEAELCLLHVEAPEPYFVGYEPGPKSVRESVAQEVIDDQHDLHAIATDLRAHHGLTVKPMLLQGATAEKILEEARRFEADLIVLGYHRHGMMYQLLFGGVDEDVVHQAPCPVMVVPPAGNADA